MLVVGMVIAVEIALMIEGLGCVALEDMIAVERDGHQPLSTTGRELLVLPGD